jgi:hypothetical protein
LVYQGLTNTSLGNASLAVSGRQLVVSNLGSSGQDGVSVSLPSNLVGVQLSCPPSDGTNNLAVGAYFQSQVVGMASGIANGVLGTVTVTKTGSTNYSIAADYSPIGASTYTLQAYLNGVLVGQEANQPGPLLAVANCGPNTMDLISPEASVHFPTNALLTLAGSTTSVLCDHIDIIPEKISFQSPPTAFQVVASQVPAFTIASENVSMLYQGLTNTSLGNATLVFWGFRVSSNQLVIGNLGSSGQDGVTIALNPGNNFTGEWLDLDPSNALPQGAYVRSQLIGTAGAITNGVLGSTTCTKAGTSNYLITVDYSPLGSFTHTVQVYNGTNLVAQMAGQVGSVCATTKLPPGTCTINPYLNQEWPNPTFITISGGPTVVGTEILMIPEGATPISSVSAEQILAAAIPSIILTNESVAVVVNYAGLPVTSLGEATLAVSGSQLVVSNLGSSGQDGVSFALPGSLALEVEWQPFDLSNMLPAAAFMQEQVVGTANGITNGPLGTVTFTKLCGTCSAGSGSNFVISADFSQIGASNFTVQAFLNGVLVGQATNQPGPSLAYCGIWDDSGCTPQPPILGGGWDWTNPLPVLTIKGGPSVQCDHLYIVPDNVSGTPTALQITASQVPVLTMTAVEVSPLLVSVGTTQQGITLQWVGTGVLQYSTDLKTWTDITNATSPYIASPSASAPRDFYRIKQATGNENF